MDATALPPGLKQLAPMPNHAVFMLGVMAFMGTGLYDLIHPFMFCDLIRHHLVEFSEIENCDM